ncbi:phosphodiesterase, MJ0936 family [Desulfotomaculum nigrificans CO-1-SRB]|uniref:Phosphoesterase n=1 Tax=Desulfotomaculum nigrificans (strain DSM 14880 / VKM B-2319 / CO-1-SRB) TaxID=868595 RepID=F6B2Q2_DESCC|nr:metallophosphoesterase family protein [Desulfotomaculum nigrificans]AEF93881.1 phosphodiesterase, MJ0936 family [Desulfotomaculum nigrificans CO-1-SRB]
MKIAIFADVHSNLLGLQAVLADIRQRGIDTIYCLGDLVGYGPRPNEVIDLLRQENIPTVMGNYDDAIGHMRFICGCDYKDEQAMKLGERSILWTKEHTSEENKAWLRQLPERLEFNAGGLKFLLVHGSPRQLNEYLFENTPEKVLNQFLTENHCDVLVCGHTHLPYHKQVAEGHVINVGSAGKPKHGNANVGYALLDVAEGNLTVEFIQVPYDFEQTAREIEEVGLPREFAQIIRTGKA